MHLALHKLPLSVITFLALIVIIPTFDISTVQAATPPGHLQELSGSNGTDKVFFPDYDHFVADPVLHYWRANGRLDTFGGPISGVVSNSKGQLIQYFQKMALDFNPVTGEVRPYEIGRIFYEAQPESVKKAAPFAKVPATNAVNQQYFAESGHKVSFGFLDLYNKTGGLYTWGYPLSEEYGLTLLEGGNYTAQIFERGRMLWSKDTGAIIDPNFGSLMANFNHISLASETNANNAFPNYDSNLWEHWVDVNLSSQSETFYEGDVPVRTNLVTTGKPGHETPTGTFYILRRVYNEHMVSGTVGDPGEYDLYNVLYTQYFTYEGHALHYAWWRSEFGVTGSHGCVNEDYASSEFAWNWLSLGSRVNIHY